MTWVCGAAHHAAATELLKSEVRCRITLIDWMDQTQLQKLLDTHGVFIFPSHFEGFGKAPLEAMSRGLCVIATAVGGMKDYIDHERSGFLVPPGRSDQIVEIAGQLMNNLDVATQVSSAARSTAEQHTWDRCAADVERFYLSLLVKKRSANV